MKKILLFASALAGLFLAGSCQRENLEPQADKQVTFTIEAPAAMQTKAIADGQNVDQLIYEVWITGQNQNVTDLSGATRLYQATTAMEQDGGRMKANITLDLVNDQNFTVLFWAQQSGINVYNTEWLNAVTYQPNTAEGGYAYAANDNRLDAFYGKAFVSDGQTANHTVTLKRPFAQVNLCTLNNKDAAQTSDNYNISLVSSKMRLDAVPTTFNVATSAVSNYVAMEFAANTVPSGDDKMITVNDKKYFYAGMNYVFAGTNIVLTYDIQTKLNGEVDANVNNTIQNVPLKENYRTNIVGNLLTSKVDYEIIVDADFNAPENVIGEEWTQTGEYTYAIKEGASATVLAEVLAHADAEAKAAATKAAGPEVKITLNGDVEWETGAGIGSTPLLPEDSPISAVVINGNGKTFTATGKGVGQVRLANGALLTFNNVKVVDHSVSYAENSWEYGYLEFGGKLAFDECEFGNAIMIESEIAAFTNCSFNSNHDNEYAVWVNEGITTFNGCTFVGARGLKIHEAYGSEVTSVVVEGCTFGPLTKKPGIALGTLNAETSVTIKNSLFIGCQPGDQHLYMYETDTDVTTFNFVNENNEVYNNTNDMIAGWIENAQAGETVNIPAGEYTFPTDAFEEGVTVKCAEGTVFTGNSKLNIKGATVIGAKFSNPSGTAVDQTINGTFKECKFEGSNALRYCYASENTVFEDCVFDGNVYGVHFDGGAFPVTLRRCQLSGFNAFGAKITELILKDCVFKSTGKSGYNGANLWGKTTMTGCQFIFDGKASTEWIGLNAAGSGKELAFNECVVLDAEGKEQDLASYFANYKNGYKVTVDGEELTIVVDTEGLKNAVDSENVVLMPGNYDFSKIGNLGGKTLTLVGSKDVVIDASKIDARNQFVTGATLKFEGVTLNFGTVNYMGFANTASLTYKNCDINGLQFLYGPQVVFEGCSLNSNGAEHSVWTYGVKNVNFTECDFTYGDRCVNCYSDNDIVGGKQTVNFTACTFATENTESEGAVEINSSKFSVGIEVNMDSCTAPKYGQMAFVSKWDSTNGAKTTINIQ